MSIVRTCLRAATVEALRARTWAANRVYDSNNAPIDAAARESPEPWLTVFTDTDERRVDGRDIFAASQKLQLVIEFGIGGAMPAAGDGEGPAVGIPATDAAFERAIDAIERQIINALAHDPASLWGELWRDMVSHIELTKSDRGAEAERSSRWAARALTITLDAVAEPPAGVPLDPEHPVAKFLAACKDNPQNASLPALAHFIEAELAQAAAPNWRQAQALLGLTEPEVRGIGLGPPYDTPDTEVDLAELGFEPPDTVNAGNVDGIVNPQELPEPAEETAPPLDPPPNRV